MKEFTYTNIQSGKVLYQTVEENYISKETVDKAVLEKTGQDPRLQRHTIDCQIRVVRERTIPTRGRIDKNKRMQY